MLRSLNSLARYEQFGDARFSPRPHPAITLGPEQSQVLVAGRAGLGCLRPFQGCQAKSSARQEALDFRPGMTLKLESGIPTLNKIPEKLRSHSGMQAFVQTSPFLSSGRPECQCEAEHSVSPGPFSWDFQNRGWTQCAFIVHS